MSGGLASACTNTLTFPLKFVAAKLATDMLRKSDKKRKFSGILSCIKETIKSDGVKGLYQGASFAILEGFMYRALWFGLYDFAKNINFVKEAEH